MSDSRVVRAEGLLTANGISAGVSVAGHSNDILAVRVPMEYLNELRMLSGELKTLGFRYVALELDQETIRDA